MIIAVPDSNLAESITVDNTARVKASIYICVVILLSFVSIGCSKQRSVTEHIKAQIGSGASQVDVGQSAGADWDHMFMFGPYTPKTEVCRTLKLSKWKCATSGFDDYVDEGEFLLVFMKGEAITRTERFPRFANFDTACLGKDIPRSAAQFTVERKATVGLGCR